MRFKDVKIDVKEGQRSKMINFTKQTLRRLGLEGFDERKYWEGIMPAKRDFAKQFKFLKYNWVTFLSFPVAKASIEH